MAHRISAAFVGIAAARLQGDAAAGTGSAARHGSWSRGFPTYGRASCAACWTPTWARWSCAGVSTHRAALTLRARAPAQAGSNRRLALDCLGQLALLEAFQGEPARGRAACSARVEEGDAGRDQESPHAHLAKAWVHLERAEPALARQHLDRAAECRRDRPSPGSCSRSSSQRRGCSWLTDQPEAALRLLRPGDACGSEAGQSGWTVDQLALASAEALLASRRTVQALDLVTPASTQPWFEGGVLAASAHLDLGEADGAAQR